MLLTLIWGVNFAVIKGVLEHLPPLAFNALRFPLASAVLALFMLPRRGPLLPGRGHRLHVLALGLLGNVVYQLLFIQGIDATSAGNASLLLSTTPVWTVLLSVGTGQERLPGAVWLGVLGTVAGMGLVVAGGAGASFGADTLTGDLLMIGSAGTWAIYTVGSRPLVARYGAMPVTAWTLWIGTPGLVLVGIPQLAHTDLTGLGPGVWGAVAYAGVLAISVAYLLWNVGIRRLGNARTAVYSNLVPVVALAAAWIGLGERPTPLQLGGAVVILGGLTLTRLRRVRAPAGASPPGTRRGGSLRG